MNSIIIKGAKIVNEGKIIKDASILVKDGIIDKIFRKGVPQNVLEKYDVLEADGKYLIPGVIDDQVHFREPGNEKKAEIYTEAKAAVAGGVTSFMDMPNTNPPAVTLNDLENKYDKAGKVSLANYSFYLGATNDNVEEIKKADPTQICGVKVFMGSSTGNLLVDKEESLNAIFKESALLIATHCEDEKTVRENMAAAKEKYGEDVPIKEHAKIRSAEACFKSSSHAVELAKKYNSRLHILHLSSAQEMALFNNAPIEEKRITSEICVHHLFFNEEDYEKYGNRIKWNPSIKSKKDQQALIDAFNSGKLDVVATDHAPHLIEEKNNTYFKAPSGGPLVQHSLVAMLEMTKKGYFEIEKVVDKMCHAPALAFKIEKRGYIRKGYKADLVLIDNAPWEVNSNNIHYKCGWSPFEGDRFTFRVTHTFVNGNLVYKNDKGNETFYEEIKGERLTFAKER